MEDDGFYAERLRDFRQASRAYRAVLVDFEQMIDATVDRIDRSEDVFRGNRMLGSNGLLTDRSTIDMRNRYFEHRTALDEAFTRLRAEGVRRMVDDLGWTLTRVAALTERSRQFTTRLYRQGRQWRTEDAES
jgi:hypothetical protein